MPKSVLISNSNLKLAITATGTFRATRWEGGRSSRPFTSNCETSCLSSLLFSLSPPWFIRRGEERSASEHRRLARHSISHFVGNQEHRKMQGEMHLPPANCATKLVTAVVAAQPTWSHDDGRRNHAGHVGDSSRREASALTACQNTGELRRPDR